MKMMIWYRSNAPTATSRQLPAWNIQFATGVMTGRLREASSAGTTCSPQTGQRPWVRRGANVVVQTGHVSLLGRSGFGGGATATPCCGGGGIPGAKADPPACGPAGGGAQGKGDPPAGGGPGGGAPHEGPPGGLFGGII